MMQLPSWDGVPGCKHSKRRTMKFGRGESGDCRRYEGRRW